MSKSKKISTELTALKGRIREKGLSYQKLSLILGIATATFSQKINGYSCFNVLEVNRLIEELDISTEQIVNYFFPHMFRKETRKTQDTA